jgi:hypothetical protein
MHHPFERQCGGKGEPPISNVEVRCATKAPAHYIELHLKDELKARVGRVDAELKETSAGGKKLR